MSWQYIGSGTYARTFTQAEKLITTTRTGPRIEDIVARSVFDADSGVLLDQCNPDNTADNILHRRLPKPRSIRVEVMSQSARKLFEAVGADIAEVYSPPKNCSGGGHAKVPRSFAETRVVIGSHPKRPRYEQTVGLHKARLQRTCHVPGHQEQAVHADRLTPLHSIQPTTKNQQQEKASRSGGKRGCRRANAF